jgi:hypothetical protein
MCACKETDVRESQNDSTLAGGEGQGGREEMCHPQYRESPVSSMIEHTVLLWIQLLLRNINSVCFKCQSWYNISEYSKWHNEEKLSSLT